MHRALAAWCLLPANRVEWFPSACTASAGQCTGVTSARVSPTCSTLTYSTSSAHSEASTPRLFQWSSLSLIPSYKLETGAHRAPRRKYRSFRKTRERESQPSGGISPRDPTSGADGRRKGGGGRGEGGGGESFNLSRRVSKLNVALRRPRPATRSPPPDQRGGEAYERGGGVCKPREEHLDFDCCTLLEMRLGVCLIEFTIMRTHAPLRRKS